MKKILALVLVCIMSLCVLSSCATTATEIKVNLVFKTGDDSVYNFKNLGVAPVDGKVTIIQAVNEAIAQYDLKDLIVDANGYSIAQAGIYKTGSIDGYQLVWVPSVNGVEPTTGTAATNTVADGDTIEYTLNVSWQIEVTDENGKVGYDSKSAVYDSSLNLFNEDGSEEETEAEEESAEDTEA